MIDAPLVSIVVNNYNYGHFLGQAIRSALEQSYPNTEVIVVDDGSTDDSREVIANFGSKVISILKSNEGQASTFNVGFEQSRGDIIVFLDADDYLLPQAVEQAVPLLQGSEVVKVHWPLWEVDQNGKRSGKLHKPSLIEGDFREQFIRKGPISLPQSPTSGNAWSRWFLDKVIPLPEHKDKHGADGFLKKLCPIFGTIRRLDEPQGCYRIHGGNYGGGRDLLFKFRRGLSRYETYCRVLAIHLQRQGVDVRADDWMGPESHYSWLKNAVTLYDKITESIPRSETIILIDDDTFGKSYFANYKVLPFLSRAGDYWGAPKDDRQGIQELERMKAEGSAYVVFAFTAFWWLKHYQAFFHYLESYYECSYRSDCAIVFDLQRPIGVVPTDVYINVSANTSDYVLNYPVSDPSTGIVNCRSIEEICLSRFNAAPTEIKPIGESSNNRRAFRLRVDGKKIKCYECENAECAQLVQQATRLLQNAGVPIPPLIDVIGHVVFAKWVSGKHFKVRGNKTAVDRLAAYQAQIHQTAVSDIATSHSRFNHLEWLLERVQRVSSEYINPDKMEILARSVWQLIPPGLKSGIVQPDFIESNIVDTRNGELVIIDNEFLGIGIGFEFDILNTSYAVSKGDEGLRRRYLDVYDAHGDYGSLAAYNDFWEICYLLKLTGKAFLNGDVESGKIHLRLLDSKVLEYRRNKADCTKVDPIVKTI